MSIGKKLFVGPSLTLHNGWQVVPLDATRLYGPKRIILQASTAADVTLSTDCNNEFIMKSGTKFEVDIDGNPFGPIKGDDLIDNGAFSATGKWWNLKAPSATGGTGWHLHGGHVRHNSATGALCPLGQTLALGSTGTIYEVQYDTVHPGTGATGRIKTTIGGGTGGITGNVRAGTDFTENIYTHNATGPLRFYPAAMSLAAGTGYWGSIDNVSVKKISGGQLLFAKATAGVILQVMFTV